MDTGEGADFVRTHWSVVRLAAHDTPEGTQALETLCRTYWRPVYAFVRHRGYAPQDAQDITQGLFLRLLTHQSFATADPRKGRFRSFLLGALQHFLADEWDKARAAKRGGGQPLMSLDELAESHYHEQASHDLSPDQVFAQQWAWTLIHISLEQMAAEYAADGHTQQFELLKPYLTEEPHAQGYDRLSLELGTNRNTIAKTMQRLRERLRLLIRHHAAQTVSSPAELDDELRQLFA